MAYISIIFVFSVCDCWHSLTAYSWQIAWRPYYVWVVRHHCHPRKLFVCRAYELNRQVRPTRMTKFEKASLWPHNCFVADCLLLQAGAGLSLKLNLRYQYDQKFRTMVTMTLVYGFLFVFVDKKVSILSSLFQVGGVQAIILIAATCTNLRRRQSSSSKLPRSKNPLKTTTLGRILYLATSLFKRGVWTSGTSREQVNSFLGHQERLWSFEDIRNIIGSSERLEARLLQFSRHSRWASTPPCCLHLASLMTRPIRFPGGERIPAKRILQWRLETINWFAFVGWSAALCSTWILAFSFADPDPGADNKMRHPWEKFIAPSLPIRVDQAVGAGPGDILLILVDKSYLRQE